MRCRSVVLTLLARPSVLWLALPARHADRRLPPGAIRSHRIERSRLRGIAGLILIVLLAGAVLGAMTLVRRIHSRCSCGRLRSGSCWLDDIATAGLLAAYGAGVLPGLALALDGIYGRPFCQPTHSTTGVARSRIGMLAGVLALNLAAPRFWCRYLCPLGALYGFLARVAPFRLVIGPECKHCGRCVAECKVAAIAPRLCGSIRPIAWTASPVAICVRSERSGSRRRCRLADFNPSRRRRPRRSSGWESLAS